MKHCLFASFSVLTDCNLYESKPRVLFLGSLLMFKAQPGAKIVSLCNSRCSRQMLRCANRVLKRSTPKFTCADLLQTPELSSVIIRNALFLLFYLVYWQ